MLAVGEHLWGQVDQRILRMTTALGGGLGGCHEEICGALNGAALLIGARFGRTAPTQDDTLCYETVCLYRDRFLQKFNTTRCHDLRESGFGSEGMWPCSALVQGAALILLDLLDEASAQP